MNRSIMLVLLLFSFLLSKGTYAEEKPPPKNDPTTVLAKVGDRVITMFDLEQALLTIPQELRQEYSTPEGQKELLQNLIDIYLFEMEARRLGLQKNPALKAQINIMVANFLSRQLVLQYIRSETKPPSEDDLKAYYNNHLNEFTQPEEVLARHILVRTRKEAEEVLALLKNGGDFVQLARERSIAPDAEKGGLLGWFSRGKMVPNFENAAFELKKGEISNIVWTRHGYHIIMLEDRKPAFAKPYEQVKHEIYAKLVKSVQDEAMQNLRNKIMKKVKVEILDGRYAQELKAIPQQ